MTVHSQSRLAALVIGLGVWLAIAGCAAAAAPSPTPVPSPTPAEVLVEDPSIGPADAPIVIQEYGDFSCPHCAIWHQQGVMKQLQAEYGGKVRFVWHDYAVLSPQSRPSALAAHCAADQGKFWEYHDVLFDHYPALENADLKRYAAEMGLDTATFNDCLDTEKHFAMLGAGLKDGIDHGFFATPSFLVNDKHIVGGQELAVFEAAINSYLPAQQ